MKILVALSRLVFPPEQQPTPPAKPFDDGLVEIARLLANASNSSTDQCATKVQRNSISTRDDGSSDSSREQPHNLAVDASNADDTAQTKVPDHFSYAWWR